MACTGEDTSRKACCEISEPWHGQNMSGVAQDFPVELGAGEGFPVCFAWLFSVRVVIMGFRSRFFVPVLLLAAAFVWIAGARMADVRAADASGMQASKGDVVLQGQRGDEQRGAGVASETTRGQGGALSSPAGVVKMAHSRWRFLGCRRSHHSCHHLAARHGYHHATLRYNSRLCHHHPHLACFAWN